MPGPEGHRSPGHKTRTNPLSVTSLPPLPPSEVELTPVRAAHTPSTPPTGTDESPTSEASSATTGSTAITVGEGDDEVVRDLEAALERSGADESMAEERPRLTRLNEKMFVRGISLGLHPSPDKPDAWPRKVLDFISRPVVRKLNISVTTMMHAFFLTSNFIAGYFLLTDPDAPESTIGDFNDAHMPEFLLFALSCGVLSFTIQSMPCIGRDVREGTAIRFSHALESAISVGEGWANYLELFHVPTSVVADGYGIATSAGFGLGAIQKLTRLPTNHFIEYPLISL